MNTPNVLVVLQATSKRSRVWRIANEIAEFRRAQLHVIKLTQAGTASDSITRLQTEAPANQASWPDVVADGAGTAVVPENAGLEPIVVTAKAVKAELVIVGANRRKGLRRLLPSATHRLSHAIDCSVLTIRSNGSTGGYRRTSIAILHLRVAIEFLFLFTLFLFFLLFLLRFRFWFWSR